MTKGVFVALGANLGDRQATLAAARAALAAIEGVQVITASRDYETTAEGGPAGQLMYLNAVVELTCELEPEGLLAELQRIEQVHGRQRSVPNEPRTLDLDLLLFGESAINTPVLTVPHPRMWTRDFVLRPLREICGEDRMAELRKRFHPLG
jgi:2-amino-4-hydroxy-6-hydroxymethyldihydropteridine diphosphokinase